MSKIYFIGDLHFGDETIIQLERRPFKNVAEQTETFVENWNKVVAEDDEVYVLGDVIHSDLTPQFEKALKDLNGKKYLIKGNHDIFPNSFYFNNCGFDKIYDHPIIVEDFWILSHEPMYVNENFPYANIFAHVHNNPIYKTHSARHYCVSAERINYTPISFDKIKSVLSNDSLPNK